jgi:hypothetical protein
MPFALGIQDLIKKGYDMFSTDTFSSSISIATLVGFGLLNYH